MTTSQARATFKDEDERQLAEMGYKQDLNRAWSAFSNFAISFTIISVLAGCFTTYGQAWNNGGPIAISWGWPLISIPILIIGFCMSELVAKYPTAGGIYWWAGRLGGPGLGLVHRLVQLARPGRRGRLGRHTRAPTFMNVVARPLRGRRPRASTSATPSTSSRETFLLFAIILLATAIINIFRTHLLAMINNISVFWHVARRRGDHRDPRLRPRRPPELDFVFTERINNSGFDDGSNRACSSGSTCCRSASC